MIQFYRQSLLALVVVAGIVYPPHAELHAQIDSQVRSHAHPERVVRNALDEPTATRSTSALERPVTVDLQHETLEHAIKMLALHSNVRISYQARMLEGITTRVSLHAMRLPLGVALETVLSGTGLRAEVVSADAVSLKVASGVTSAVTQGRISGKVVDATTQVPLRGATISVDGSQKGVTSADDGTFHLVNLTVGSHTVNVRLLGYLRVKRTVTIVDGQTASVVVALEPSVSALDQVVVTGTIAATAQKAIPNAITVITAKELEQRGVTHIDQLFRGDVPGVFSQNSGTATKLGQVAMFSRGATSLGSVTSNGAYTNAIKTYVDGVELADPSYLSQIDPKSIERIEILTGPQASTIYGSNAINGVMQIFTKRGTSQHVQGALSLLSGITQNNFRSSLTPQHDYTGQISDTEGRWSYTVGGSWNYIGSWSPSGQTARTSGFTGERLQHGPITVDGTIRLETTQNRAFGESNQSFIDRAESGWYSPGNLYTTRLTNPAISTLDGQTLGLTLGYAPVSWWSQELVLGADASNINTTETIPGFYAPSDTNLSVGTTNNTRTSLRYSTTAHIPLASVAQAVITVGGDGWQSLQSTVSSGGAALTGTLNGTSRVTRQPNHNAGGFVQGQLGIHDALFVTYGLRAEWNPTYGDAAQPNLAPRYGVAYSRDVGPITAKLRASYGRSTRPPGVGDKNGTSIVSLNNTWVTWYGLIERNFANPDLGPETQQGGEGGLELYFGNRGSLVITRYNQTVNNLIQDVSTDTARSLVPNPPSGIYDFLDENGYGYFIQSTYVNLGNIRNQGWELQGTANLGALTAKGTYSWTKSRVIGVDARYRAELTDSKFQPGATFSFLPEHTWAINMTYAQAATSVAFTVNGVGVMQMLGDNLYYNAFAPSIRLTANRLRMTYSKYVYGGGRYATADLNATRRFSSMLDGVLRVQNMSNLYKNDFDGQNAELGRQTQVGLRIHW